MLQEFQKKEIEELELVVREKFNTKEDPFIKGLDKLLQRLNVQKQAYQGGTFVGYHVHKLLKVCIITILS